ncbi:uncharacterized protein N7529_003872 [Penicillium soppii]|uniref:uncharacterized protein n=1 Tax=Penicillium soppii TaxID=69789 RepID=UPI0025476BEF|nr:uncharacterized protein N7529_003872 [Penicillium soppii]KAJ5871519.1 hypothetical protein N7529_003872 [Penicillium soppii]
MGSRWFSFRDPAAGEEGEGGLAWKEVEDVLNQSGSGSGIANFLSIPPAWSERGGPGRRSTVAQADEQVV